MKPNLFIIGAMKCGTTALHAMLDQHSQISMSSVKETNFLIDGLIDEFSDVHESFELRGNMNAYLAQFSDSSLVKYRGEASTLYTAEPTYDGVAKRMYELFPDSKLIYLLRDPFERLMSHYKMEFYRNKITYSLVDAITRYPLLVDVSRYDFQLGHYLKYFDKSQILLVPSQELRYEAESTLRRIFAWLGVHEEHIDLTTIPGNEEQIHLLKHLNWYQRILSTSLGQDLKQILPSSIKEWIRGQVSKKSSLLFQEDEIREMYHITSKVFLSEVDKLQENFGVSLTLKSEEELVRSFCSK